MARSSNHRSGRRPDGRTSGRRGSSSERAPLRCSARTTVLLTGGIAVESRDGMHVDSATNSIFAIAPGGRVIGRYDKAHLVPYGEYLPMRPLLSVRRPLAPCSGRPRFHARSGAAHHRYRRRVGQGRVPALLRNHLLGPRRRRKATAPPSSSTRQTTPGSARWGPPQHLAQARLRAAEEGLPVIRATPTGISAVIDARGNVVKALALAYSRCDRRGASAGCQLAAALRPVRQYHPAVLAIPADHRRHCAGPPSPLEATYKAFFISLNRGRPHSMRS